METILDTIVIGSSVEAFAASKKLLDSNDKILQLSPETKHNIFASEQFLINRPLFFFKNEVETFNLIKDVGLEGKVDYIPLRQYLPQIYFDEILHQMPMEIFDFFKSKIIGPKAKLQLLKNVFFPSLMEQDISLFDLIEDCLKGRDAEIISESICSKLRGGIPRKIDYFDLFPELKVFLGEGTSLYHLYRSGLSYVGDKQKEIGRLVGGEIAIISKLSTELGLAVQYGVKPLSIKKCGHLYLLETASEKYVSKNVVFCVDAQTASKLVVNIDLELSDLLCSIPYSRGIEVDLSFNKSDVSLSQVGKGIIFPDLERERVRAITFLGEDKQFSYVRCLLDGDDGNLWHRSADDLKKLVCMEVMSILGATSEPKYFEVRKKNRYCPLYHIGHRETVELIDKKLKLYGGVKMIGNFLKGTRLENILKKNVNSSYEQEIPKIVLDDPYLEPQTDDVIKRRELIFLKETELISNKKNLAEFASGYLYFGIHKVGSNLVIREWAPNASAMYLICDKNKWSKKKDYSFTSLDNGVWEITLDSEHLKHLDLYKLLVEWDGGSGERIPSYANYVVQDSTTHLFSACVWWPENKFEFHQKNPKKLGAPIIYECHIGMSSEEGKVNTYNDFTDNVLPKIVEGGYNTVQIMAIQEHPYYGSFGYQVSNFFAPSSRSGTPDDLKRLIDTAHGLGVRVIMDIVHSHAVKNENEGLGNFDGTRFQYFHEGDRGLHPAWDTYCFNYGKNQVLHFLLSNVRYWMEEFRFDGFRHDGVTSMLYLHHGLEKAFTSYSDYFGDEVDNDAITYLGLANKMMKEINPCSISIAEDMSGLPGIAAPVESGGVGFDYRLAMGIPDFWIKMIKEKRDEDWSIREIWNTLMDVRYHEGSISYVESHDQALVGDKTTIFRLIDKDMYTNMSVESRNHTVDRGIAIQKLIRLITFITSKDGYLNFMGNEFGHPEWIDFPRKGNDWSYHYARRQWGLRDNQELCYKFLSHFDQSMLELAKKYKLLESGAASEFWIHDDDKVIGVKRGDLFFVFNFNPSESYREYMIPFTEGEYQLVMHSDSNDFGGHENLPPLSYTQKTFDGKLSLYLPARTVQVYRKIN